MIFLLIRARKTMPLDIWTIRASEC